MRIDFEAILRFFSDTGNVVAALVLFVLFALCLVLIWWLSRKLIAELLVFRTVWLIFGGKYHEAIEHLNRLLEQHRLTRSSGIACKLNKANCLNRLGRFAESTALVDELLMDKPNRAVEAAARALKGENLLMLESELSIARKHLNDFFERTKLSSSIPALAYCELLLNNVDRAEALMGSYIDQSRRRRIAFTSFTFFVSDRAFDRCHGNLFAGLFFLRKGDVNQATHHLSEATLLAAPNFHSEKAKLLLATIQHSRIQPT
jgi:tetratricopeptide (TPR) repeat protein